MRDLGAHYWTLASGGLLLGLTGLFGAHYIEVLLVSMVLLTAALVIGDDPGHRLGTSARVLERLRTAAALLAYLGAAVLVIGSLTLLDVSALFGFVAAIAGGVLGAALADVVVELYRRGE